MRRLGLLAALLVLPVLPAAPAFAADHVICVGAPVGTCDQTVASITVAISTAQGNGLTNTILVGPGTYNDGPYQLNGTSHALTLRGSGQGSTQLTLAPSATQNTYLYADHATVEDLTIKMATANSGNDTGLGLVGSTVHRVTVDGVGTVGATGVHANSSVDTTTITGSTFQLDPTSVSGSRAMYSETNTVVTDSSLTGSQGLNHSAGNLTDTLSRVKIRSDYQGISIDSGTVTIDDALIDLGSSTGTGLLAANNNAGVVDKTINADHVTIVGGTAGSVGAYAGAVNASVSQHAAIQLTNSIVEGPATDLRAAASNSGGALAASTATITVSHSEWTTGESNLGPNGTGGVIMGAGNLDVDPAFAGVGDYHLSPSSLLVDRGDPAAGGPALDLDGHPRVTDGDGNGTAVRDMGAYERPGVALPPVTPAVDTTPPATTITSKPAKRVSRPRVKFGFAASEAGSSFTCKLDRGPWRPCASPARFRVKVGRHLLQVRATDPAGNTDATPAAYRFRRMR